MEEQFLPDEPEGWRELCAKMQQERDAEKLAVMVARSIPCWYQHEKKRSSKAD